MTNVIHFEDSDFDEAPQENRDRMRYPTPPSPCYTKYLDHNVPSPYCTLTNNPETLPVTSPKQMKTLFKQPKKKPSPIRFPVENEAPKKHVEERLDLRVKLDGKKVGNTTPKSSTN